ncbi:mitochondrial ribosomal protein MRP51 [Clohesyomyces aquaticus]|uniref:Mitochondrial ribosomal protein MRP51 n=1 Tax=Clohesyomyces aquaticus TaxID=1231657 RepID=A0A1Y1Z7K6_9PLEO|nr:mitochondrial ribosomal protein MRP51 [Clohesyomyces aquaticus]
MALRRQLPRQSLSPTANLLRNSRLFSLPDPLPRPTVSADVFGSGATKTSNTATLPYPTHQAIATTHSSLARGDWGLKRPLPSRSHLVQSSNPVVRIRQLDTIEHITDFESASDHVRTREKFTELSTPMLQGATGNMDPTALKPSSAFEEAVDITSYEEAGALSEAEKSFELLKQNTVAHGRKKDEFTPTPHPNLGAVQRAAPGKIRWKHEGPWIPGMGDSEFNFFISKQLSERKREFEKYLVQWVKDKLYTQREVNFGRTADLDADADIANAQLEAKKKEFSQFTQAEIEDGIRALRHQCAADPLNSDLVQKLIMPFLRLPPMTVKPAQYAESAESTYKGKKFQDGSTPISTHPSAGLSYLRTKSYMANHPILGPQRHVAPVTARVIQPRQTGNNVRETHARLGVAGFVADDEYRDGNNARFNTRTRSELSGVQFLDIDTPGGHKLEVEPEFATVAVDGRVHIRVLRRSGEEVKVKRGELRDSVPMLESAGQEQRVDLKSLGIGKSGVEALDMMQDAKTEAFFKNLEREEEKIKVR